MIVHSLRRCTLTITDATDACSADLYRKSHVGYRYLCFGDPAASHYIEGSIFTTVRGKPGWYGGDFTINSLLYCFDTDVVIDRCGTAVDDLVHHQPVLRPPYAAKYWLDWADQCLWIENSESSRRASGREGVNLWRYYKFWLKGYRANDEFDLFTARHFLKLTEASATNSFENGHEGGADEGGADGGADGGGADGAGADEGGADEGHSFLRYFVRKCEELTPEDSRRVALCVTQNYTRLQASYREASAGADGAHPLANEWYCDVITRSGTKSAHWEWLKQYRDNIGWLGVGVA
jgi:hypothetical protein